MRLEGTRELRLIAEASAVGDLHHRLPARGIAKLLGAGLQPLVPDPTAQRLVGVAEQLVQIAGGNAVTAGNGFRVQLAFIHMIPDESLDARQMHLAHRGFSRGKRALVSLQRQHQKVDQLLPHGGTRLQAQCIKAVGDPVQHVGEQAACTIGSIELQRAEPVWLVYATAQRLRLDLQNPEVSRLRMAELIRLVAALRHETTRIAAHVLAALGEDDLGAPRNCNEELLAALDLEVMLLPPVLQRLGSEERERNAAKHPKDEIVGGAFGIAKLQVMREIGLRA